MSLFTIDHAREFAENAFRYRPDKFHTADEQKRSGKAHRPLVGKEDKLLDALRTGELRYRECKAEINIIRQLRKSDAELPQRCTALAKSLQEIIDTLSGLDEISREELNSIALLQDSGFDDMYKRLEVVLTWQKRTLRAAKDRDEYFHGSDCGEGADGLFPESNKNPGRKLGVGNTGVQRVPLEEFAKELRNFLLRPEVGLKFSFDAKMRDDLDPNIQEPTSASARLLYDAARILDHRVELADVDAVMRAVKRKPGFRKELLGDPAVDALTG